MRLDKRMNDPDIFKNPCPICKKRKATQLCDYVIQYNSGIIFVRDSGNSYMSSYRMTKEETEAYKYWTCDLPLCKDCSHQIGYHIDICPHHFKLHQQIELPEHLRKYQRIIFT